MKPWSSLVCFSQFGTLSDVISIDVDYGLILGVMQQTAGNC
jgi:hypothetical protein